MRLAVILLVRPTGVETLPALAPCYDERTAFRNASALTTDGSAARLSVQVPCTLLNRPNEERRADFAALRSSFGAPDRS